jgi:hypothetical protein
LNDELNEMDEFDMAMALSLSSEALSSGVGDSGEGVGSGAEDEDEALAMALSLSQNDNAMNEGYNSFNGDEHVYTSNSNSGVHSGNEGDDHDVDADLASALALSAAAALASMVYKEGEGEDDGDDFEVWEDFDDAELASWDFDTRNWTWQEWDPTSPTAACEFDGRLEAHCDIPARATSPNDGCDDNDSEEQLDKESDVKVLGVEATDAATNERSQGRRNLATVGSASRTSNGDFLDVELTELLQKHGLLGKCS